jgi:hypothetical protein
MKRRGDRVKSNFPHHDQSITCSILHHRDTKGMSKTMRVASARKTYKFALLKRTNAG